MHTDKYGADYFLRGKETGQSLYQDYRWLPDLTIPMAQKIVEHCGITKQDKILDFGCSRGYLVKALHQLGYDSWGRDISKWAIDNADEEIAHRVGHLGPPLSDIDWVLSKDVMEHIPTSELVQIIESFGWIHKGIFVVVPLSEDGQTYVVPEYDLDVTHVQRMNLHEWTKLFHTLLPGNDWEISARYRIKGIKDNYAWAQKGNGFITCKRIG